MARSPGRHPLPSRRGRRALTALLVLLLVLLPLYLWPLRGGIGAPLRAPGLSSPPRDPRDPAALAAIPGDVWDALMERAANRPLTPSAPIRNLTMISEVERADGVSLASITAGDARRSDLGGWAPSDFESGALLDGLSEEAERRFESDGSPSSAGPGTANTSREFASSGYPGPPNLGPWSGGGPGGGGRQGLASINPISTWDPVDPGSPTPTPEPATVVLIGSNLALFGAFAWRHGRRRGGVDLGG